MELNEETKTSLHTDAKQQDDAPRKPAQAGKTWPSLSKWSIWAGLVLSTIVAAAVGFYLWQRYRPIEQNARPDYGEFSERLDGSLARGNEHPIDEALRTARATLEHMRANLRDYTAVMSQQLRIEGELGPKKKMFIKIRNRKMDGEHVVVPLSAYLRFIEPAAGREVIWVEGENQGKMIVHEPKVGGFIPVPTLYLNPTGPLAMSGQRYPIYKIGLENLMMQLIEKGLEERKLSPADCVVTKVDDAEKEGRRCTMFEIKHPRRLPNIDFHLARIYIDNEMRVPIYYESFLWPENEGEDPPLLDRFHYTDIKVNVNLTDLDFDPDNPEYDF